MLSFLLALFAAARVFLRARSDTALEVLALRHQVAVLKRKRPRPRLRRRDRLFWVLLRQLWSRWAEALMIVNPDTVVGWHRAGFRLYWRWRSRPRGGRPTITEEIRVLIRRLAQENPDWGAPKIHGELQKLGVVISERTVARYLRRVLRRGDPGKRWLAFLRNLCVAITDPARIQQLAAMGRARRPRRYGMLQRVIRASIRVGSQKMVRTAYGRV